MLVGCNKDGTDTATGGNATPATSSSIVGKWYYPNELIDFKQQPEFDFKADGTVTGNYVGKWKIRSSFAFSGFVPISASKTSLSGICTPLLLLFFCVLDWRKLNNLFE